MKVSPTRIVASQLAAIFVLYVGSYFSLSARGSYVPAVYGTNGIKAYEWAPCGFMEGGRWNTALIRVYYPLWRIDRYVCHLPR